MKREWNPAQIKDPNPCVDYVYQLNDNIPANSSLNLLSENSEEVAGASPLSPFFLLCEPLFQLNTLTPC
jgi:hypothetical protein